MYEIILTLVNVSFERTINITLIRVCFIQISFSPRLHVSWKPIPSPRKEEKEIGLVYQTQLQTKCSQVIFKVWHQLFDRISQILQARVRYELLTE